jgi:Kef-type K+ transport system membrane component KefB
LTDFAILRDLGYAMLTAALFVLVARALRMPAIMAYLLAGLTLGPLTGLLVVSPSLERFSEVGIALLLFLVGLELSLDKIRGVGRTAFAVGMGQVTITAAAAFGLARLLGFATATAGLLALAVTFSSTVVTVKLLQHRGDLDALYGRIAVGVLLVQDLVVVVVLTLLAGMGVASPNAGPSVASGLARASVSMALLGTAAFAASRFMLPRPFAWLARSLDGLFIWSLSWCFLFIVAAEALGLSVEMGAFVAGVSLAQLPYTQDLRRRVQPLVNFFVALFFVALGANMELGRALVYWPAAVTLSALVLLGKPAVLMALIPRFGFGERTSFHASIALGQISEFSFILAGLALGAGLLDEGMLSLIGAIGIITIGTSSYLITYGEEVYRVLAGTGVLRLFGATRGAEQDGAGAPRDHIIVVGLNSLGRRIVHELLQRGERVVVIDTDREKLQAVGGESVLGDSSDESVLLEANLQDAKLVVSALQIEDANNLLAYRCRQLGVPISVHAFDPTLIRELEEIGVDHLMISKHDGIREVAAELRRAGVVR